MRYRCEATTIDGFVQQLAVSYLANGYWFYVTGLIPERKDPRAVDAKLVKKYGVAISKFARYRRKAGGRANIQYIRYGRFYALLATHGQHEFFTEECFKDCREEPIKFASYSIGFRGGHPHVGIERETYRGLKAYFVGVALRGRERLERELGTLPFQPYAPVRRQMLRILAAVNERRREAGYEPLSHGCLKLRRRIVKPFASTDQEQVLQAG